MSKHLVITSTKLALCVCPAVPAARAIDTARHSLAREGSVGAFVEAFDKTQWAEQYRFISHSPAELELVAGRTVASEGLFDPDVEWGRQQ